MVNNGGWSVSKQHQTHSTVIRYTKVTHKALMYSTYVFVSWKCKWVLQDISQLRAKGSGNKGPATELKL